MRKKTRFLLIGTGGFTLIEIVIVIALTSIIMVMIFQALTKVRENETKFADQRQEEKEIYLLHNRLSNLFNNLSSFKVFNNREETVYFKGTVNDMIFFSRAPLISRWGGIYFIQLYFDGQRLLYREMPYRDPEEGGFVTFEEIRQETFHTLVNNVSQANFQYYILDDGVGGFAWLNSINTYEKDPLPLRVSLELIVEEKQYSLLFYKVIKDESQEIPEFLLK